MAIQKKPNKGESPTFKVGDLVRYVRVHRGVSDNLWQRSYGIGILTGTRSAHIDHTVYEVMANDEIFDTLEIHAINQACTREE